MRKRLIAAALAIAFTLGCEEKSSPKPAAEAEDSLTPAAKSAEYVSPPADEEAAKPSVSCKEGSKVKLIESIADGGGLVRYKFEYDEKLRVVKKYGNRGDQTIIYDTDGLVTIKEGSNAKKYVKKGNTIIAGEDTLTIDKDGYIVFVKSDVDSNTYEYFNGNLTKQEYRGYETTYEYDDKKSPFSNTNTPKWVLQSLFRVYEGFSIASKNNVLSSEFETPDENGKLVYEYKYDSEGFLTKEEYEVCDEGECETKTIHYTYLCH